MNKRIDSIDILRGMSIIGILFMNIVGFHMNEVYTDPLVYFKSPLDQWLYKLNIIFIHNSFYPIFAFLFGFGLAIMAENIKGRGGNFIPVLYRRMAALLVFGLLHGFFLFYGDILNVYAVIGLAAIIFLLFPNIITLITAIILIVLNMMRALPSMFAIFMQPDFFGKELVSFETSQNEWIKVMSSGNLSNIVQYNSDFFYQGFAIINPGTTLSYFLTIMPFILLGMFVKRANLLKEITEHKVTMFVISFVFAFVGITLKYLMIAYEINVMASYDFIYYGGVLLFISYIIWVTLLCEYPAVKKLFEPFQRMGKMSFTLYIMQSLLMFIVFYVFRQYGQLSIAQVYLVALAIVLFQMIFTSIYFKKFKQGPLEWIWRKITYMK
ncbi:hypothetical protein BHU61_00765 [Macrococcus epidermidis]|uniref:DUF418 domain-containing protein n=1 Tax=Macrococcus epidermidis TaxID=1902580 RepID=A0A327ZUE3_9STAP|nr:DUF418 domain-containing protein [Macrococcus epidermidis]RAK46010.1 hypothetical protein BHU61_00765 [Macrococcus epidermidis]